MGEKQKPTPANWAQALSGIGAIGTLVAACMAVQTYRSANEHAIAARDAETAALQDQFYREREARNVERAVLYAQYYKDNQCLTWCMGTMESYMTEKGLWEKIGPANYYWLYQNLFHARDSAVYRTALILDAIGETDGKPDRIRRAPNDANVAKYFLPAHGAYLATFRIHQQQAEAFQGIAKLAEAAHDKPGANQVGTDSDLALNAFRDHLKGAELCRQGFHGGYDQQCRSTCETAIRQSLSYDIIINTIGNDDDLKAMLDRGCDVTRPLQAAPGKAER